MPCRTRSKSHQLMSSPRPLRQRLSISPEKMILSGLDHDVNSACARTFFILGDAVVWSHHPHISIIHCFQKMRHERDRTTLREYDVKIAGELTRHAFDRFRSRLTGVLGDNRRLNKAGRIWLKARDEDGGNITVVSFWAKRSSISDPDILLLQQAFQVKLPTWVDYIDRERSTYHSPL